MADRMGDLTKGLGNTVTALKGLAGPVGALTVAVGTAAEAFRRVNDYAQKNIQLNERLLLLGSDQISFFKQNIDAMEKNSASIYDQMAVATEMRDMGLDQFRNSQVSLASNMKMTGQNTKAALDLFLALEKNTEMSFRDQESLASTIEKTADSFGRTAESIVTSLNKINNTYLERTGQSVLEVNKMVAEAAGLRGQDFADATVRAMEAIKILKPEDLAALGAVGGMDDVRAFMESPNLKTLESLANTVVPNIESNIKHH